MTQIARRDLLLGAAMTPVVFGDNIVLAAETLAGDAPPPLHVASISQVKAALAQQYSVLEPFQQTVEEIIRSAFSAVDLTPPWPPNNVFVLAEDVADRVNEILDLRQQLIDLEQKAFETASMVTLEGKRLSVEKAIAGRDIPAKILQQAKDAAAREKSNHTGTNAGFKDQAEGRERIANTALIDWNSSGKSEINSLIAERENVLSQVRATQLDPDSVMNFKKRHERLAGVLRDCAVEGFGKAACLKVGLEKHFNWTSSAPFPKLIDDGIVEKLMIWTRSVGRYLESLGTDRYFIRFLIPMAKQPIYGPQLLADGFASTNIALERTFVLNDQHFTGLDSPLLRGVGLVWAPPGSDTYTTQAQRRAVRVAAKLAVPRQSWTAENPLATGQIGWATGGTFRFDGMKMLDSEGEERLTHCRLMNISPVGSWTIQLLPNLTPSFSDGFDQANIRAYVADLRLQLDLSVKAPPGT